MAYEQQPEESGGGGLALLFGVAGGALGYAGGRKQGQEEGYELGHNDGLQEGFRIGLERGRQQAAQEAQRVIQALQQDKVALTTELEAKRHEVVALHDLLPRLAEAELALAMHRAELPDEEESDEGDGLPA